MMGRTNRLAVAALLTVCLELPAAARAGDVLVCAELKAAVADAERGFASHKGSLAAQAKPALAGSKTFQARQTMTGAGACRVVEATLDGPAMLLRQTAYRCDFPRVFKLDKAWRTRLMDCVAGEVDDPSDPEELTVWVERVSSGEGYRATEVNAQVNAVNGLALVVRQSVCTNKGEQPACED